jgi:hypothetical protein
MGKGRKMQEKIATSHKGNFCLIRADIYPKVSSNNGKE